MLIIHELFLFIYYGSMFNDVNNEGYKNSKYIIFCIILNIII